jgi:valyl-tRNA synthetase
VWKWKEVSGNRIGSQIRRLGASVDWSREVFTMDAQREAAVEEAFLRLHDRSLIRRDNRLVNWSCALRSAISNVEVDYLELDKPTMVKVPQHDAPVEFGVIHSFAYQLADGSGELVVATTRIETMLGDVAVAVHPDDERYKPFHGKSLKHPFIPNRDIRVVTDPELVDMAFGTGAVKVTPAHDPNDYRVSTHTHTASRSVDLFDELYHSHCSSSCLPPCCAQCGQRHKLQFINLLDNDGRINANGGEQFKGMKRFEARTAVLAALEALGLYRGKAANKMSVGICSRSKDIIEPVIRPQWYVDVQSMAKKAADAVRNKQLEIIPAFQEPVWYSWLDNPQDWCVSRQLWWGHRIPAYLVRFEGEDGEPIDDAAHWFVGRSEADAKTKAEAATGKKVVEIRRDADVLDTWFSSGLFPFSVMGWPNQTADLAKFYPGALLETGHDILFFWVARMVMLGLELTGTLPFKTVYLHAMVRDKFGRKMVRNHALLLSLQVHRNP